MQRDRWKVTNIGSWNIERNKEREREGEREMKSNKEVI
jgi:hypothetical protein